MAPAALPLFRSTQQMRLLGVLFADRDVELAISELASAAGVAVATASREVERLAAHGVVVTRQFGRMRMVSANWDLPWAGELASILTQTVGVPAVLTDALAGLPGVQAAYVFGSWAARHAGEAGPAPSDIDLLVVGDSDLASVRDALTMAEQMLGIEINPVVVDAAEWEHGRDPFLSEVRARPTVRLLLGPTVA